MSNRKPPKNAATDFSHEVFRSTQQEKKSQEILSMLRSSEKKIRNDLHSTTASERYFIEDVALTVRDIASALNRPKVLETIKKYPWLQDVLKESIRANVRLLPSTQNGGDK